MTDGEECPPSLNSIRISLFSGSGIHNARCDKLAGRMVRSPSWIASLNGVGESYHAKVSIIRRKA